MSPWDPPRDGAEALILAASDGDAARVRALLAAGVDVEAHSGRRPVIGRYGVT